MTTLRSEAVLERTAVPERATSAPRSRREPWFDNIKMTLIVLVVVGHSWALLPGSRGTDWAYDFLYSWHMPAFAIITGYFSRSFAWTPKKLWSLVCTVAVPYFVFEYALAAFRDQVGGVELHDLFSDPHWPMWYLVALFFWRLAGPAFLKLPRAASLALATAISLLSGFVASDTLETGRVLGFLPFFVLGLHLGTREWRQVRAPRAVPWAVAALVAVFALARLTDSWITTDWYYYRMSYDALGVSGVHAVLSKAGVLAIGLVGAFAMFALVPRGRSWFSTLGSATLVVYLFHGFFILLARYRGFPAWADQHLALAFVLATASAVGVALALAAPPVARRLNVAVDPLGALERKVRAKAPSSG
ncbi:MAG: acyltransferase family protein [Marmoricola sp.]